MPSIDLLEFVERFLGALTNFVYSLCGSIWLLIRRPAPAARYLARRVRAPDVRQVGPLTLHFLGFVLFFAALQMTYSGRGAYADYDGADMMRRLTPGWGGELSWELGRVLMGALAATAVTDAAARLLANLGWPLVASLQKVRRRSKTRRDRAVQAGFALVVPLAAASLPSLLLGYLLSDNVPDEWPWWVTSIIGVLVAMVFIAIAGWVGNAHLRFVPLKKTPANQLPGVKRVVTGYLVGVIAIFSIIAGMMVMGVTERAFRVRVYSNAESVRIRLLICSIGADRKVTVTGLVANIGTRLAALDVHAQATLEGSDMVQFKLILNPVPPDGPMLVLKPGEGRAFTFVADQNDDPRPFSPNSYQRKGACWLNWQALGPNAILDHWGDIEDHRAAKK
ncbi:MAG: hypothetical protein ACXWK3_11725 [Reyranella sp.]